MLRVVALHELLVLLLFTPSLSCAAAVLPPARMPPFAAVGATGVSIPFKLAPLPELRNVSDQAKDTRRQIYVVPVSVAGETFELIMDTGSADLWVDTSILPSGTLPASEQDDTGVPIELKYGLNGSDTTARGTAQLANVGLGSLAVRSQAFGQWAYRARPQLRSMETKVFWGWARDRPRQWSIVRNTLTSSQWNEQTFLYNVFKQYPTLGNFFTVEFGERDHAGVVQGRTLSIGEVLPSRAAVFDAPKLQLATGRFWDVSSGGFLVNGVMLNITSAALLDHGMMLDTGAFGAYIPPEYLAAIYGPIDGSSLLGDGAWGVPCDTKMNVSVIFGDIAYPIHPLDMTEVYEIRDGTALCRSLFQPNTDARIPFLIGLNVLRNTYMLFNYGSVDDSSSTAPYVQILGTTDTEEASRDFDAMNTARIAAYMVKAGTASTASAAPSSLPALEDTVVEMLRSPSLSRPNPFRGLAMYLFAAAACVALVLSLFRSHCRLSKKKSYL